MFETFPQKLCDPGDTKKYMLPANDRIIPPASVQNSPNDELVKKAEWLRKRIEVSLNDVKGMKNTYQKRASYIKVISICLTGTATILLGLQISGFEPVFKDTAFVLGALVTLVNAFEPFFNYRALWIENEIGKAKFHRLKDDFDYYMAGTTPGNLNIQKLDEFQKQAQDIWTSLGSAWQEHRGSNRYNA